MTVVLLQTVYHVTVKLWVVVRINNPSPTADHHFPTHSQLVVYMEVMVKEAYILRETVNTVCTMCMATCVVLVNLKPRLHLVRVKMFQ